VEKALFVREVGRSCSQNGESRSAFKDITSRPTGKRTSWSPRWSKEDDIRADPKEISINTSNCHVSVQDAALNLRFHKP
jgi:hypothetical protein